MPLTRQAQKPCCKDPEENMLKSCQNFLPPFWLKAVCDLSTAGLSSKTVPSKELELCSEDKSLNLSDAQWGQGDPQASPADSRLGAHLTPLGMPLTLRAQPSMTVLYMASVSCSCCWGRLW